MSSQPEVELAVHSAQAERLLPRVSIHLGYITLFIGYLSAILLATHPTTINFVIFTVDNALYCVLFWRLTTLVNPSRRQIMLLMGALSGLTLVCGLLFATGIGLDWLLYLVTVIVYFSVFSLRTAIISTVLLFIVLEVNLSFLNNWNWLSISESITGLLPAFAFVAISSLMSSMLTTQKERTEQLLHQLEESNAQLEQAHAQLRSYASEVEELTVIRERTRVAREIHDTLGHYLSILTIQLETISKLQERDPARAIEEVAETRRVAAQAMQEVRNAVAALRPTSMATPGLVEALTQLGRDFEHTSEGTKLTLDLDTSLPPISPDLHVALYRAAQEALTNIRKHAHASKVLVRLRYEDEILELVVLDNGSGTPQSNDGEPSGGFGLIGLRERIELLGGKVSYGPSTPSGYRVTVQIRVPSAGEFLPSGHLTDDQDIRSPLDHQN